MYKCSTFCIQIKRVVKTLVTPTPCFLWVLLVPISANSKKFQKTLSDHVIITRKRFLVLELKKNGERNKFKIYSELERSDFSESIFITVFNNTEILSKLAKYLKSS
jgi:hypothetical protein